MDRVTTELGISERRACRALGQHRSTQRKIPTTPGDEAVLTADIIELARQYGRYGYRRITALLRSAGWTVNKKRVERIWRCEGLKVPSKQPKRGRLWLNDGSCIRLRPERANHVWSYDFVADRTHDGKAFRMHRIGKLDVFAKGGLMSVRIQHACLKQQTWLFRRNYPIEMQANARCSIPDDHIDPRRSAFFMARSVLRDIRSGVRAC